MRKDKSLEKRIADVASTVTAIETLRSRLFVKQLPFLHREHAARTIFCDGKVWVVITAEVELLDKVTRVMLDDAAPTGEHVKLFGENDEELRVPKDVVVLYQGALQNPEILKDLIESAE